MIYERKSSQIFLYGNRCDIERIGEGALILPYDLQRFASGEGGEKTEDPTAKKLTKARSEGQVAKSHDLVSGFSLLALFITLKIYIPYLGKAFMDQFTEIYGYIGKYGNNEFTNLTAYAMTWKIFEETLIIAFPFFLVSFLVAFILNAVQIKWKVTLKPLRPKMEKLSVLKGFKKMFSVSSLVELAKSIAKLLVIAYVVFSTLKDKISLVSAFYQYSLTECLTIIGSIIFNLGIKISVFLMVIGFVDLFYQKRKFKNEMKMSKQEVKDEYKQSEGDPKVKGKIRRKMQEASMRRMMKELPKADVVITNPTHFAVAIKYEREKGTAPMVIAKGEDHLAQKIKEIAKANDIEIYEDKPLARMLYYNVEIGQEIPPELYQMVAEVLAYVYKLKNKL